MYVGSHASSHASTSITLLVCVQPAGMAVHVSAGHHTGTLVNALLYHCGLPGVSAHPHAPQGSKVLWPHATGHRDTAAAAAAAAAGAAPTHAHPHMPLGSMEGAAHSHLPHGMEVLLP